MKQLLLVDGHAVIYRAYHALTALTTADGQLVNAVYGFTRIILKVLKEFRPQYVAVCFDSHHPTFRHTEYLGYKADRPAMPEDLRPQIDLVKEVVDALNIPRFELPGYEADDLIGTVVAQAEKHDPTLKVIIVTGDRDAFQLVTDQVHVYMPGNKWVEEKEYGPADVEARIGVRPDQVIDLKSLMGDASDAIPGVKGIGEKTAVKLIQTFGGVDQVYQWLAAKEADPSGVITPSAEETTFMKPALIKKLAEGHEMAMMSKSLATIDREAPITLDLLACTVSEYDKEKVFELFRRLQFNSLINQLPADDFELSIQHALF